MCTCMLASYLAARGRAVGGITSDQNLFWMNSLGISNAAINARLRSISASLEPASLVSRAFPDEAISSRIEDTATMFVAGQLFNRMDR